MQRVRRFGASMAIAWSKSNCAEWSSAASNCDENQTKDLKLLRLAQDRRVPAGISIGGGLLKN
jgi:hypothetical protein